MTDFAFNQTLLRQHVGFGAPPPSSPQPQPQPRAQPRAQPAPSPAPPVRQRGVGRDPAGVGQTWWNTATLGPVLSPWQTGNPPSGGPTWWQYAWIYMSTGGYPIPTNPPPGVTGSGPVIGTWVETSSGHWVWFPPDNTLTQINGIWVMGNSNASGAPTPWQAFPAPTVSPDGTQGTWSQAHKGYWVWTPGAAVATSVAGLSTGTMILLAILGIGAIGGIGYLLLD